MRQTTTPPIPMAVGLMTLLAQHQVRNVQCVVVGGDTTVPLTIAGFLTATANRQIVAREDSGLSEHQKHNEVQDE